MQNFGRVGENSDLILSSLWIFLGETTPTFHVSLFVRISTHYLAKFGLVSFADVCLRSLAMKKNAEFTEGG